MSGLFILLSADPPPGQAGRPARTPSIPVLPAHPALWYLKFSDNTCWRPGGKTVRRDVSRHHGVRTDHRAVTDGDPGQHRDVPPQPDVVPQDDRPLGPGRAGLSLVTVVIND